MKKLLTFLLISVLYINTLHSQKFYALVVANTYDASIGKSCEIDLVQTTTTLQSIARAICYEPVIMPITKDKVTVESVNQAIANIHCTASDIVLFYFSGHGENSATGDFPTMLMLNGKYSLELAHQQLKDKKARFTLSFADCCNQIAPKLDTEKGFKIIESETEQEKNFKNLFVEPSGDIVVSASSKGQFAYGNSEIGGIFTHEWISTIIRSVNYAEKPSWTSVLNETRNRVEEYSFKGKKQTPFFKINVTVSPQPIITFDVLNLYFSDLLNTAKPRRELREAYQKYFEKNARVNLYVDTLQTDVMTVEAFLDRIYLNNKQIRTINLIENKSKLNQNGNKYQQITVQELWRKE